MLDSYEKASLDILHHLKQDPTIFIINAIYFRVVIDLAAVSYLHNCHFITYDHINITDVIPNIFEEITITLPYPPSDDLKVKNHFVTELVGQYGDSWVPVVSPDYKHAASTSFIDNTKMFEWQRYLRATNSKDQKELTVLSTDSHKQVRELALKRLKTI